jgi:hypothetical protein
VDTLRQDGAVRRSFERLGSERHVEAGSGESANGFVDEAFSWRLRRPTTSRPEL